MTDSMVQQWDLNTGQVVRTFTKHRGQISTIQLRPENVGPGIGNSMAPSLIAGSEDSGRTPKVKKPDENSAGTVNADEDIVMQDAQKKEHHENGEGSDYDSLFGDDDGEKQEEDADETSAPTKGDSADVSENGGTMGAKDTDFPFGGPPAAPVKNKVPLGKPVKPPNTRPNMQGKQGLPTLTPAMYRQFSDDVMLVSAIDGEVALHDRRVSGNTLVGRLESSEKTPPWCMSVSRINRTSFS